MVSRRVWLAGLGAATIGPYLAFDGNLPDFVKSGRDQAFGNASSAPDWLAQVCGEVVSLYKQPRTKVFARPDEYGRHLNVLVYLPRERYSESLAEALAHALRLSSGASDVMYRRSSSAPQRRSPTVTMPRHPSSFGSAAHPSSRRSIPEVPSIGK